MGDLVPGDERREDSVHQNVGGKSAKESPGLARRASSPLKKGQQENPGCSGCHHLKFTLQRTRKPEIDGGQIVRAKINQKKQNADLHEVQRLGQIHSRVRFILIQENGHHEEHAMRVEQKSDQRAGRRLHVKKKFEVSPAKVGQSPDSHPESHQHPERADESRRSLGRLKAHRCGQ